MRNGSANRMYRTQEFAELASVTVRALHHYDRLDLLKPRRTDAGYRLYGVRDLERLEQIVALKFLGLSLKQIKALLEREKLELSAALRMQRKVLEQRRSLLDRAIRAIREAESAVKPGRQTDAAVLKKIIEVIEMQDNTDWMLKYHTPEARQKVEARRQLWSPELQERVSKQWAGLMAEVETALGEDPAGPRVQALAERWIKLVEEFTGGDQEIAAGVRRLYADQANWPAGFQQQAKPFMNPEVWTLMQKAIAIRKASAT
ncbi:Transcriptional regulator, MerR family [Candidatus Sulfopaludibacter sp. SbA4]|nr:Transcriptional regulator, MerR family [Candidatus Sulfopaludibacter sp. SbA4]